MALQTITPKHQDLWQITIWTPYYRYPGTWEPVNLKEAAGEEGYRQWIDLESLLVQLLGSRATRTTVANGAEDSEKKLEMYKQGVCYRR